MLMSVSMPRISSKSSLAQTCTIPQCTSAMHGRGFCVRHYKRFLKGHPLITWREQFIIDNPPRDGIGLIPLTKEKFAVVDEQDFLFLMQWKWQASERVRTSGRKVWYALGRVRGKLLTMHGLLAQTPKGCHTDH